MKISPVSRMFGYEESKELFKKSQLSKVEERKSPSGTIEESESQSGTIQVNEILTNAKEEKASFLTKDKIENDLLSKKSIIILKIISIIGILVIILSITLSVNSSEDKKSSEMETGDFYVLNYSSRTVVTNRNSDFSNNSHEVTGNSTFSVLVLKLEDENLSFLFAEGNFSANFSIQIKEYLIDFLSNARYFLVDSEYQTGEISRIRYPEFMNLDYVESIIPYIKGFLVNYKRIKNVKKNEKKIWNKSFTKSESVTEDENFYIYNQNFVNNKWVQARFSSGDFSKKGLITDVDIENWITQFVDKKTMKLTKYLSYLRADLNSFNFQKGLTRFETFSEVQIYEEKFKVSKKNIQDIMKTISNGNLSVFDEDEDNDDEIENRLLQENFLINSSKPLLDIFGNNLTSLYTINNSTKNITISKFLLYPGMFYRICHGVLNERAANKIEKFFTLKNLYESQSDLINKSVLEFSNFVRNTSGLLQKTYMKIFNRRSILESDKETVKMRIDLFLESFNNNKTYQCDSSTTFESRQNEFEIMANDLFNLFLDQFDQLVLELVGNQTTMDSYYFNIIKKEVEINNRSRELIVINDTIDKKRRIHQLDKQYPLNNFQHFYDRKQTSDNFLQASESEFLLIQKNLNQEEKNFNEKSEDFYDFLLDSLIECCRTLNDFENEYKLLRTDCEVAMRTIEENRYRTKLKLLSTSLDNLNKDKEIINSIQNSRSGYSGYLSPSFIKNQKFTEDYLTIKMYSMDCEKSYNQTINVNIMFPYEPSITVPMLFSISTTKNQNTLITNDSATVAKSNIEERIAVYYSGTIKKNAYEVVVHHDAVISSSIENDFGYGFSIFSFYDNGNQKSNITRTKSVKYRESKTNSHQHCWWYWFIKRCETHYESYWTSYYYSDPPSTINTTDDWNFFSQKLINVG